MRSNNVKPIIQSIRLDTTPAHVYRSLTSQTELRKWLAPRVITAKNIVSFEEDKDIEMRMLQSEKNQMVRFNWRPMEWNDDVPETILTFEIQDRGVSRNQTGEGIVLTITHDGWSNEDERDKQKKILTPALAGLKGLLEGKKVKAWWEKEQGGAGLRKIKFSVLKQFAERIESENWARHNKKLASQNILKLCQNLDGQGVWFIRENRNEIEMRFNEIKLFGIMKNGNILLIWRDLEEVLGKKSLKDFSNRLALEQGADLHLGKTQDKIPGHSIHADLFTQWILDVIQFIRNQE